MSIKTIDLQIVGMTCPSCSAAVLSVQSLFCDDEKPWGGGNHQQSRRVGKAGCEALGEAESCRLAA